MPSDQFYPPGLARIADPPTQQALRLAFDRLNSLVGRANDPPTWRQSVDANGKHLHGLADPVADQDAVTRAYADAHYGPEATRAALEAGGQAPLNLFNLPGLSSGVTTLVDTHANRLSSYPPETYPLGTLFFETDRAAFYQVQSVSGTPAWVIALCRPLRSADPLPADLGANDGGFTWFDSVAGATMRWSGGAWNYYLGSLVDVFANRPAAALADRGFLFIASDLGSHVWRKGTSAWVLLEGVGGPTRGVLASLTGGLTADDAGYQYFATDFDRAYRWTGAAWADAPGQPQRGQICYFDDSLAPGAGWALADGSTVTRSTATGGTASYTTPNLTGSNRFIRSVAGTTGGTGGSATTHTHTASAGNDDTSQVVLTGVGTTVAAHTHQHAITVAGPSGTGGDDALPPYLNLRPYVRL